MRLTAIQERGKGERVKFITKSILPCWLWTSNSVIITPELRHPKHLHRRRSRLLSVFNKVFARKQSLPQHTNSLSKHLCAFTTRWSRLSNFGVTSNLLTSSPCPAAKKEEEEKEKKKGGGGGQQVRDISPMRHPVLMGKWMRVYSGRKRCSGYSDVTVEAFAVASFDFRCKTIRCTFSITIKQRVSGVMNCRLSTMQILRWCGA